MSLFVSSHFTTTVDPSPTAVRIAAAFGIGLDQQQKFHLLDNLELTLQPRQVILITGQSGSGKSTLLRILKRFLKRTKTPYTDLDDLRLRPDRLLPDHFNLPLEQALRLLSIAGLADAFIFLRTPNQLSDGQRYRFRLALALARTPKTQIILADKFLENLDRISAAVIAHNTRKFADKFNTTFVLATTNDDIAEPLDPNQHIQMSFTPN